MKTLKNSFSLLKTILLQNGLLLLFTFVLLELTQHHFLNLIELSTLNQDDLTKIIASFGQVLTSLTEYIFFAMLVPLRVMECESPARQWQSFSSFTRKYIGALTAEGLRAMGVILLWSLLLIIPGIYKYLRLFFVPYVVVADPQYEAGQRDALAYSNAIVKGFTIQLLAILIVLFGFEILRDYARTQSPLMTAPALAIAGGALFFIFSLYVNILLFKIYQLRVAKYESARQSN